MSVFLHTEHDKYHKLFIGMWMRRLDSSVEEFGRLLLPESTDRQKVLPLAALAIRNGNGRIALRSARGVPGAWFPTSPNELPVPKSKRGSDVIRAVGTALEEIIKELGIRPDQIRRVSGLLPAASSPLSLLALHPASEATRQTQILPLGAEILGQPQMPNISWFSPSEAGRHISSRSNPEERAIGIILLNRALTGHRQIA